MKKEDIFPWIRLLLAPVLVILLGAMLVVNPDSASVLIARVLGALLGLLAVGFGVAALISGGRRGSKVTAAIILAVCGGVLSRNPLILAAWIGRIIGILLLIDGLQDVLIARSRGVRVVLPVIVGVMGLVLLLLPLTASRLVFSLCGVVVLIIGVMMLLDRLRRPRLSGDDDRIIDAL